MEEKILTFEQIQKDFGDKLLVVGPSEIFKVFSVNLTSHYSSGFTGKEIERFLSQSKNDFGVEDPPVGLFLLVNRDVNGNFIDFNYLKKKFIESIKIHVTKEFTEIPVRWTRVLTHLEVNPIFLDRNLPYKQYLAKERGYKILTATEEIYKLLLVKDKTGRSYLKSTSNHTASFCDLFNVCVGSEDGDLIINCDTESASIDKPEEPAPANKKGLACGIVKEVVVY